MPLFGSSSTLGGGGERRTSREAGGMKIVLSDKYMFVCIHRKSMSEL